MSFSTPSTTRRRLLITAYHYDYAYSMESRLAWQRAQHAAREYDVTVLVAQPQVYRSASEEASTANGVALEVLPHNGLERALMRIPGCYYIGYRLWHRRAYAHARRLNAARPFALVHHVSFCGYREPSDCWQLTAPFVWGPVGGTQPFPAAFFGELGWTDAAREAIRNVANDLQLKFGRRIRRAARKASCVLAANCAVAADLERELKLQPHVQLETGVDLLPDATVRTADEDRPLRILWAGRLQPWKGFPLLLKGLAALPPDVRYSVRVLGQGPCEGRWRRLAEELGVAQHIDWIGWPDHIEAQLPHYRWADAFAFTSLRDTSGTGLLEALAAGAPLIGLDHQGVADIMTPRCALPIAAATPQSAIQGFKSAVARLADDRQLLATLSAGAIERARDFAWERQWNITKQIYESAERRSAAAGPLPAERIARNHTAHPPELVETCS